jgi:hypothetical protein
MAAIYQQRHGGCAIVCGAAPSLFEDLAKAKALRPHADILGVNHTPSLVPEIQHVWTQHGDVAASIKSSAGREVFVHARPRKYSNGGGTWLLPVPNHRWALVDYEWPTLTWLCGSSGIAGALWARHGMGYDEVIMAGIPLNRKQRTYADGYASTPKFGRDFAEDHQVENWLNHLRTHKANGKTEGITSMSGETARILGVQNA